MGTDIHCWAERRTPAGWEVCRPQHPERRAATLDFYCGQERNYELFAILAGVQRLTNAGFEPIVPPRGLPDDAPAGDPERMLDGASCHNATWLTLRELQVFRWREKHRHYTGYVTAREYRRFKERGRPREFSNADATIVSHAEMDRRLTADRRAHGVETLITFGIAYAEFAGPFVTETLPLLATLGGPDDVRIVMFFDS